MMRAYRFISFLQGLFLVLASLLLGMALSHGLWFTALFLIMVVLVGFMMLFRRQQHTVEQLIKLVKAIRFSDFSLTFSGKDRHALNGELARELEEALRVFKEKTYQLEEREQFYHTLLSSVDSGLIVADRSGKVLWHNREVQTIFGSAYSREVTTLSQLHPSFPGWLEALSPREIKVIQTEKEAFVREIALNMRIIKMKREEYLLIHLKDLGSLLDRNELEAWQKLIRVLTHEIMNSLAPVISLSETLLERLPEEDREVEGLSPVFRQSLQAIHRRSKGLSGFVRNYRRLTGIHPPQRERFPVSLLFSDLQKLFTTPGISYDFNCSGQDLNIFADRAQIEQVLINLIRNAEESFTDEPERTIRLTAWRSAGDQEIIEVRDNGPGMEQEVLNKIFVPFYTTKKGGSGIGLSLSKQIMNLHGGNITVVSEPGKGSIFKLSFMWNK